MTKTLRIVAIKKRTELETNYLKNRRSINLKACKKQGNLCSKLCNKERNRYYNKLNLNSTNNNKEFWRAIKPFLSGKVTAQTKISLLQSLIQ